MSARAVRSLLLLPLLLQLGCAIEFTEPWEVIEPRLMAARVEVEGASERPRPLFGERFALRQYLALPGPLSSPLASRYSVAVALCLGVKTLTGELRCLGEQPLSTSLSVVSDTEILLSGLGLDPTQLDLSSLGLPQGLPQGTDLSMVPELASLDRLSLFGVLCVDGKAERVAGKSIVDDPPSQLFRCVDNAGAPYPDPSTFTLSVLLDRMRPIDQNRNPSFACDPAAPDSACALGVEHPGEAMVPGSFVLARPRPADGSARPVIAWPARAPEAPLPWTDCASDPTLLQVGAGSGEHILRARFDPSDRELYQYEIKRNGELVVRDDREALLLSHALTSNSGKLSRFFSRLGPDEVEQRAEISFAYTPPKHDAAPERAIPENGRLVRFYFTLRDERGGIDFATRELCLVPSAPQG